MKKAAQRNVIISVALSIILHLLWLGFGMARYNPQDKNEAIDRVLSKPGVTLAMLVVPKQYMSRGAISSWLLIVFLSLVFYALFFWLLLTIIGRFKTNTAGQQDIKG